MPAPAVRTFRHSEFPVDALVEAKAGRRISVVLPARNEAPTIGPIVAAVRRNLIERGLRLWSFPGSRIEIR